jgi:hypothetical protein
MVSSPAQRIIELCPPLNCPSSEDVATHYEDISGILALNYTKIMGSVVSAANVIRYAIPVDKLEQSIGML